MYIEFTFTGGNGHGMISAYSIGLIKEDITEWAQRYDVTYITKIVKSGMRLCLKTEADYVQFGLTWNPKHSCSLRYRFVNP